MNGNRLPLDESPANKQLGPFRRLWAILRKMDRSTHQRFMRAFPKALPMLDKVLEALFSLVTNPAFAIIAALLLVPLVATNVINLMVGISIFAAWLVALLWIARTRAVKGLTVGFRLAFICIAGFILAASGSSLGKWSLNVYNRQKTSERAENNESAGKVAPSRSSPQQEEKKPSTESSQPKGVPPETHGTTDTVKAEPQRHGTMDTATAKVEHRAPPEPTAAQIEVIQELEAFIVKQDEISLRKKFGFPEMMDTNIRAIINNLHRYRRTGQLSHYALPAGETLIDSRFAQGHIRQGGGFLMDFDDTTIFFIVLPKDYSTSLGHLKETENSPELPTSILNTVKDFDATVSQNATHLIEVLNGAMNENKDYYFEYDNPSSPLFHKLDALYLDTFIQLRPKADKVRDSIRQFLAVT